MSSVETLAVRVAVRVRDEVVWDERHRVLSSHPTFSHCSRREVRWLVRRGEFVTVGAGEVLWPKDRIAYWLIAIFAGEVELAAGRRRARVGPGAQLGGDLIVAFAPTPTTATTVTAVDAFALNRRDLLGMVHLRSFRMGLGLPTDEVEFRTHVRRLRDDADTTWARLRARGVRHADPLPLPASFRHYARSEVRSLPAALPARERVGAIAARRPVSRRRVATFAAALLVVATVVGFVYRPPLVVTRAGEAIDVTSDVTVEGATEYPINGSYLLLPVVYERPALIPLGWSVLMGERPIREGNDDEVATARAAYVDGRTIAARLAIKDAGLDASAVRVTIRERDLTGASAGLVYELLVADLLTSDDVAKGRTIAATGVLDDTGRVLPVLFEELKLTAAARAGADVVVVPAGPGRADRVVHRVSSVRDAMERLRR